MEIHSLGVFKGGIRLAFETYVPQRGRSAGKSTIRVLKNGNFSISAAAYQKWFDKASHVELLFDPRARKVGLKPRSKPTRASYKLRESPQGGDRKYVSGAQFLEACGVKLRKARSFDAKWNDRLKLVEFALK
jgi:hypothetical protein